MFDKDMESLVKSNDTLIKRFDIPVEHLDYTYVQKCNNVREIERILKVLRSGEEGFFPDLIKFVEDRLITLDPQCPSLRVELPVLKTQDMSKDDREVITKDISEWIDNLSSSEATGQNIFKEDETFSLSLKDMSQIPIRGSKAASKDEKSSSNQIPRVTSKANPSPNPTPTRIKAWEYDKWDKFDVDEELMRMDVKEMQIAEWEKVHKPRISEIENSSVQKLMKNLDKENPQQEQLTEKASKSHQIDTPIPIPTMNVNCPSFIEEIRDDVPKSQPKPKNNTKVCIECSDAKEKVEQKAKKAFRRVRIQIEDVNIPFL